MKQKFTLTIVALLFVTIFTNASTYDITFAGSGATLERVKVENITKGTSLEMEAGNTLRLTVLTGLDDTEYSQSCNLYPNPMTHSSTLAFENPSAGNVSIFIIDLQGRIVYTHNQALDAGNQQFRLGGLSNGVYSVIIKTASINYQTKLISTGNQQAVFFFEHVGNVSSTQSFYAPVLRQNKAPQAESAVVTMDYTVGDELKFIGYANGFANASIFTVPTANAKLTFNFVSRFYRINGHQITSSFPDFVDLMFSVTDKNYKGVDNLSNLDFIIKENNVQVSPSESYRYVFKTNTIPYNIRTVLLIDNSSSLENSLNEVKQAALTFVDNKTLNQDVAIYTFSDKAYLLQDFTKDDVLLRKAINDIELGYSSTNLYGAFITGLSRVYDYFSTEMIQKDFLVLFTDGDDTQNSHTLQEAINARGNKSTFIVGLGSDLTPNILNQLANPGPFYKADKISDLKTAYQKVQQDIQNYATSFYWLNYMTPKRSGNHSLTIEVKDNTNTGVDASHGGNFSANNFISVMRGTFININPHYSYGWMNIDVNQKLANIVTTNDPKKEEAGTYNYNIDLNHNEYIPLKAVTYWAKEMPSYVWSTTNDSVAQVKKTNFNSANLTLIGSGKADIILTDTANNYTTKLKIDASNYFPVVKTLSAENIGSMSARVVGEIPKESIRPDVITGIRWGINSTTLDSLKTAIPDANGRFSVDFINKFNPLQHVYFKAFAVNKNSGSLGNLLSTTMSDVTTPLVVIDTISEIRQNSATVLFQLITNNGNNISEYGVCWDIAPNPTINNSVKTFNQGQDKKSFETLVEITGLTSQTTYYIKAYAKNSKGISYSDEISLKTVSAYPAISNVNITEVTANSVKLSASISSDEGKPIISRGFCLSTDENPTVENDITQNGTGLGSFSTNMSGLKPNTKYFARAYASNGITTGYGAIISFKTLNAIPNFSYPSSAYSFQVNSPINDFKPLHTGGITNNTKVSTLISNSNYLYNPIEITIDANGNLYVLDEYTEGYLYSKFSSNGNYIESKMMSESSNLSINSKNIICFIDNKSIYQYGNFNPIGTNVRSFALDKEDNIYYTQGNHIYKYNFNNPYDNIGITTNSKIGYKDGELSIAEFSSDLRGIAVHPSGDLYVVDKGNNSIRKISNGIVSTFVSSFNLNLLHPDIHQQFFYHLYSRLIVDDFGNMYFTGSGNNDSRIFEISPSGKLSILAGSITHGYQNGIGSFASFNKPSDLTIDSNGNLYVVDYGNKIIRKISRNYSIYPKLPKGLAIDFNTGTISGIPNVKIPTTTYTITGTNELGSHSTTITIEVK